VFSEGGDHQESLYKSADVSLYEAQRGGLNTWRYSAATSIGGEGESTLQVANHADQHLPETEPHKSVWSHLRSDVIEAI
jgi:hypothetical protein